MPEGIREPAGAGPQVEARYRSRFTEEADAVDLEHHATADMPVLARPLDRARHQAIPRGVGVELRGVREFHAVGTRGRLNAGTRRQQCEMSLSRCPVLAQRAAVSLPELARSRHLPTRHECRSSHATGVVLRRRQGPEDLLFATRTGTGCTPRRVKRAVARSTVAPVGITPTYATAACLWLDVDQLGLVEPPVVADPSPHDRVDLSREVAMA